ncbi:hypothetical protein ACIBO2_03065 [Nonomuraea sp. NPDC050022]|uniref:hypothetical protein n=1 Tax=Nonomuraea sp. NPDC050022 TaxID=3364358 RepID=UPI0037A860AD
MYSSPARRPLTDESIDRLLEGVAEIAEHAVSDHATAEKHYRDSYALAERVRQQDSSSGRVVGGTRLEPLVSLIVQRVLLAESMVDEHEEAAQKFIAWWVDLAVCAVMALLTGVPLTRGRAAAGDPSSCMCPAELACLPPIPEDDRKLAELAGSMDQCWTPEGIPVGGKAFAAELGLILQRDAEGNPMLVEDGTPEGRRQRLWGEMWRKHRMPLLPETDDLVQALTAAGVAPPMVDNVRFASGAVEIAVAAKERAWELSDEWDGAQSSEESDLVDSLWKQADELPHLLAAYARVLTALLPTLRALGNAPEERHD